MDVIDNLAVAVGEALTRRSWMLATAESCTGGWVAQAITSVAGSSAWFDRGFVTYTNEAKQTMLGVRAATLSAHGAVSEAVVQEMCTGVLANSDAEISIAVSGVAGPGGGSSEKPVGTVWLGWATRSGLGCSEHHRFDGDRRTVRRQAVIRILQGIVDLAGQVDG